MQAKLRVMQGSLAGKEIPLATEFVIGRGEQCHLRPASDAVSRQHCAITIQDGQLTVRDFGSKNGTYVNEQRVEESKALQPGDVLQVGPLKFEVLIEYGLGGAKRPVAQNVKEVAARTAAAAEQLEDDVSSWLEDPNARSSDQTRTLDSRVFKVEETRALDSDTATNLSTDDTQSGEIDEEKKQGSGRWKKKDEPGKLPPRPSVTTNDSREAAAEMLRKFFNRR